MNDADTTPTGNGPLISEVDLALGQVASRLKEIAGPLRAGQLRFAGMSDTERTAFVRNAAARLRQVEHYAGFAASLFEEEFIARPRHTLQETPKESKAIAPRSGRLARATKLLGAIGAILGTAAGLWRAIFGPKSP